ncbi:MAG: hypothetical protein Q8K55_16305 [Gemmatimonadaceae bacterium]|nr:hypothetical protein [Gemmatimonadaceae bacterium]
MPLAGLRRRWALALLVLAAGCRSPTADVAVAEQLAQVSEALVAMQDQIAMNSVTVDSLVRVLARQDTLIRRLAAVSGVPVP